MSINDAKTRKSQVPPTLSFPRMALTSTCADEAARDAAGRYSGLRSRHGASATECVRSRNCHALQGWVSLRRMPNPLSSELFTRQSRNAGTRAHRVVSLPCRTAAPSKQIKEFGGNFHDKIQHSPEQQSLQMVNLSCVTCL